MAEFKVIEGGAAKAKAGPAVRAGLLLLALEHFGGFIFGGMWGVFARPSVEALLADVPLPHLSATINQIMNVSLLPLSLAVVAVLAPLFGWWIYSRIEPEKQTETGWAIAGVFTAGDVLFSLIRAAFSGVPMDAFSWGAIGFMLVFGAIISILWVMLFMSIGFLTAKLFKAKL
jgi:hypothetical protein